MTPFPEPRSLSIFFPTHNEESTIGETIEKCRRAILEELKVDDFEILVVNDGSTDRTSEIVAAASAKDARIREIRHPGNFGYGAALVTGYTSCKKEIIFYTDADLPIDFADIGRAWDEMKNYDAVIGFRIDRRDTPRRMVYSRVYNLVYRVLTGVRVRDVNFSFKMIHRRAVESLILRSKTVYIDGELLAGLIEQGCSILEMPVAYHPRKHGVSSFDHPLYAAATLLEMLADRFLRLLRKRWSF